MPMPRGALFIFTADAGFLAPPRQWKRASKTPLFPPHMQAGTAGQGTRLSRTRYIFAGLTPAFTPIITNVSLAGHATCQRPLGKHMIV